MGLATDAINRLGLAPEETKKLLDAMPVAYAVTYIFGTVGSAIILALIGPALLGIDLEKACKRYEEKHGGKTELGGPGTAWHRFELRAFRVKDGGQAVGKTVQEAEALLPEHRVFIERIRRGGKIMEATVDAVIQAGDIVAVVGRREVLVNLIGAAAEEVDDRELLAVPTEGVDVYVTNKEVDGKTLAQLAKSPWARGVFLRKITRGATATDIPMLPNTQLQRGDIVTLVGRTQDIAAATKSSGLSRPSDRRGGCGLYRCCHRDRRPAWRLGVQNRQRPSHAVHLRRRVDCRPLFRLAALSAPDLWPDPLIHGVVHEFGRPERVHCRRRHLVRARVRRRPATTRLQPVPLGRLRYDAAADPGDVRRKVPFPLR